MNDEMIQGKTVIAIDHGEEMVIGAFCEDKVTFMPHDGFVTISLEDLAMLLNSLYVNKKMEVSDGGPYAGIIN